MAEKVSTLVLKVDLGCSKCYNKVRKTLCQHHYNIRSQVIDIKAGTITITGPFDPVEFEKKLKSKAGKAIKNIDIKKKEEEKPKAKEADKPAEKPKAKEADKPAEKPKAKEAEKPADKPKAKEADKPAEAKADKPKQADKPKEDKAAEKPKEDKGAEKPKKVTFDEPQKAAAAPTPGPGMKFVEPGTVLAYPIVHPYGGGYTVPCYEGYVEGGPAYDTGYYGRPVGYDHGYGAANTGYYGNNGYNNNRNINNNNNYGSDSYFSERDPSCTIM
ncbi:hypothetical protein ACHQM5_025509 [Ranunculus cassubicifolius]